MKTYEHQFVTYLKDINMYGTLYYSRIFEWHGVAREAFFTQCIIYDMLAQFDYAIATVEASNKYVKEITAFMPVKITVNTRNLKHASTDLVLKTYDMQGNLLSEGTQTVALMDRAGNVVKAPQIVRDRMREYEITA